MQPMKRDVVRRICWISITVISVVCLPTVVRLTKYLMLPATPPFDLTISFHGMSPSEVPLSLSDAAIDGSMLDTLIRLNLYERIHEPEGVLWYTTKNPTAEVRVLMLSQDPVTRTTDLPLPITGSIVYILKDGNWRSYPLITAPARQQLHIEYDSPRQFTLRVTGIRSDTHMTLTSLP